jgi:tetratricopeptide (TPR) repeat protein
MRDARSLPARQPRRVATGALALALAVVAALGALTYVLRPRPAPTAPAPVPAAAAQLDDGAQTGPAGDRTDRNIAFWEGRLRADRRNYIAATLLAGTWMQKARETGAVEDYGRAEAALRAALRVNPRYDRAQAGLASVYFAEHRFADAVALAAKVAAANPGPTEAFAVAADARLELGDVAAAASAYRALLEQAPSPPVYSRLARLAFLQGRTDEAIGWATRSVAESADAGATGETRAWYRFQLGDLQVTAGRLDAAGDAFAAALRDFPGYYLAAAGLARVAAARGDLAGAEALYTRAVEAVPRPDLLAALADVQSARGEVADARRLYATVAYIGTLAAVNRQVYNRQLALFDADHGLHPRQALRLAETELRVRKDVYGWDAVAWTAYQAGEHARADAAARQALALGTRDPRLLYHAGMAALGVGDRARARALLGQALAINPTFDLLQAPRARAALAEASR